MTTPQEHKPAAVGGDADKARNTARTALSAALVGVVLVLGLAVSTVIVVRGSSEPLAPPPSPHNSQPAGSSSGGNRDSGAREALFEQDPVLDNLNRAVYVPLDQRGVPLNQRAPSPGRAPSDSPGGVMLQLVHGAMVLPFTETDGPTGFTGNGIAVGFSRSAQGAGIAGAHYIAYLTTGVGRIEAMREAGLVEDRQGVLEEQVRDLTTLGESAPSSPGVLPYLNVEYFNDDLARISFGTPLAAPNGETGNYAGWLDLAWRDDRGWIVLIRGKETFGSEWVDSLAGWAQWW